MFSRMRRAPVRVSIASSIALFATQASAQPPLLEGEAPAEGQAPPADAPAEGEPSSNPAAPAAEESAPATEAAEPEATASTATEASTSTAVQGTDDELAPTTASAKTSSGSANDRSQPATEDSVGTEDTTDPGDVDGRREGLMPHGRGPIGHFYTALPDVGGRFSVRFRIFTDFFVDNAFMVENDAGADRHARVRGGVALGFSPFRWGEVFFSVRSASNHNSRPVSDDEGNEVGRIDESYFVVGDVDFGVKAAHRFKNGIGVGGQVGLGVLPGSERLRADAVSVWLDALFAVDARYLTKNRFPFRFAANIGWIYDSSLETANYGQTIDRYTREVARFSLEGNHNRVRMRYAVDFPARVGKKRQVGIDPILEWAWDISHVEEPAFAFEEIPPAHRLRRSSQWLTLGLRTNPVSGLFLDAAVDIGLVSPDHEFGPAVPPWQLILGLGWAIDPVPRVREVPAPESESKPAIAEGRILGRVVDPEGMPVANVQIHFPGLTTGAVVTDTGGNFTSYRFPAGAVNLQLHLDGQMLQEASAEVADGKDTELTIQLETMPVPPTGIVRGEFGAESGQPLAVQMHVVGQGVDESFDSDASGQIALELYAGDYRATLSAAGYVAETVTFTVPSKGEITVAEKLALDKPPETPLVSGSGRSIRLRKGIRYNGTEVATSSHEVLDQLAAYLQYHQEITLLRVGVHTDDEGNPMQRSEARAEAVKAYLVGKGVSPTRLEAKGYGNTRPVAVNLTSAGRAKNNRTTLGIVSSTAAPEAPEPSEPPPPEAATPAEPQ